MGDLREKFEERIALISVSTLVLQLMVLIVLIIFIYGDEYSNKYYFYVFSICSLIFAAIYFAWHSLVKENAFELFSFLVMSSILNYHGIYMVFAHPSYLSMKIFAVLVLGGAQLFYYGSYWLAFRRFGWRYYEELQTTDVNQITAFKVYETFKSVLKLDFFLYVLTAATYSYYILDDWSSFQEIGLTVGAFGFLGMLAVSVFGIVAVRASPGYARDARTDDFIPGTGASGGFGEAVHAVDGGAAAWGLCGHFHHAASSYNWTSGSHSRRAARSVRNSPYPQLQEWSVVNHSPGQRRRDWVSLHVSNGRSLQN